MTGSCLALHGFVLALVIKTDPNKETAVVFPIIVVLH